MADSRLRALARLDVHARLRRSLVDDATVRTKNDAWRTHVDIAEVRLRRPCFRPDLWESIRCGYFCLSCQRVYTLYESQRRLLSHYGYYGWSQTCRCGGRVIEIVGIRDRDGEGFSFVTGLIRSARLRFGNWWYSGKMRRFVRGVVGKPSSTQKEA